MREWQERGNGAEFVSRPDEWIDQPTEPQPPLVLDDADVRWSQPGTPVWPAAGYAAVRRPSRTARGHYGVGCGALAALAILGAAGFAIFTNNTSPWNRQSAPYPAVQAGPIATPTPSPTVTPLPTETPTPLPTATPEPTDTPLPTATDTPQPVVAPAATDTPIATDTPEPSPTAEPTDTPQPTDTPDPTDTTAPQNNAPVASPTPDASGSSDTTPLATSDTSRSAPPLRP